MIKKYDKKKLELMTILKALSKPYDQEIKGVEIRNAASRILAYMNTSDYSNNILFNIITDLKDNNYSISTILSNINSIKLFCMKTNKNDLYDFINRLHDDIDLINNQIDYIDKVQQKITITDDDYKKRIENLSSSFDTMNVEYEKINNSINNTYSNLISILGLFSGIVLVFFGGTKIFGDVINCINKLEFEEAILYCSIVGIILFNIVFMFIYYIAKLLGRDISASDDSSRWTPIFNRFKIRYPIIYYFNVLMLGSCTLCSFIMMIRKVLSINVEDTTVYEYLKEYIIFTIENNFLVFMACIIYITFMIGFVFAYLYAKITDINIGLIISLDYGDLFDWMYNQEENKFTIYKKGEYYKEVENFYEIEEIIRWKN